MTYLGQFIAHDIVPPTNKNHASRKVSPVLNLDSIYGDMPLYILNSAPMNTGLLTQEGKFTFSDVGKCKAADFCRTRREQKDPSGHKLKSHFIANIPEQRNDENVIIAQFHMLWQKLHNVLLDTFATDPLHARELVTILFQCVVIEEFLRYILDDKVYRLSLLSNRQLFDCSAQSLPDFFTKASYRFGHSIVRRSYKLQDGTPAINIGDLFRRGQKLEPEHVIDWKKFFSEDQQHTARFDTRIASPMTSIPSFHAPCIASQIASKNLEAGQSAQLPCGIEFVYELLAKYPELADEVSLLPLEDLSGASFETVNGLDIATLPLWPYLLLEAQQLSHGISLGPLGSILNAEVLKWSMMHAEFSVFREGVYNFAQVVESLGPVGLYLIGLQGTDASDNGPKLTMKTIIQFIQQQGTGNGTF